jgi:hypothetical protein
MVRLLAQLDHLDLGQVQQPATSPGTASKLARECRNREGVAAPA